MALVGSDAEVDVQGECSGPSCPLRLGLGVEKELSQARPSKVRPAFFFWTPPHCLKKKGTPLVRHCCRMSLTQTGFNGLAPCPLSPPTMTQAIPCRSSRSIGSSKGSIDRKRTAAGTLLSLSTLHVYRAVSIAVTAHLDMLKPGSGLCLSGSGISFY